MSRTKGYHFETTCVASTYEAISPMVEDARQISRRTFRRYVPAEELRKIEAGLGYNKHPKQGLTMAADWHVSYHRSTYEGRPCVYFCWSAIEHIFTAEAQP